MSKRRKSGRLVCRKVSKQKAVRLIATDRRSTDKVARGLLNRDLARYYDTTELSPPKGGGVRYIDIKRPEEGFRACTDTRDYLKNPKRPKSRSRSKAPWGIIGVSAVIVGGVAYLTWK